MTATMVTIFDGLFWLDTHVLLVFIDIVIITVLNVFLVCLQE